MAASENTTIRVGVYDFPPVAQVNHNNQATGLLGDLLTELEAEHPELSFEIIYTSPRRRHLDFNAGLYDVMFFEHRDWSWDQDNAAMTSPILRDEEVYVALDKDNRDQTFFDNLEERRIVAIAGYHYGFAGLETGSAELNRRFDIELSFSHQRNIELIRADRPSVAEVAVISRSFLSAYFSRFPEHRDRFLISDEPDQRYELGVVIRRDGPVTADDIEDLLQPLINSGRYQELVKNHGLMLPQSFNGLPAQN
jgi:ABC-type amino acid transport substrate-binding protein